MNIVYLQTFVSIVESGSLVRASEQLHVTQSTVTARLKSLEDSVGQILLNRDKSGVTLTPAGRKLLRYAKIMTGLWRQARRETALPKGLETVCTVGCHPDLWDSLGQKALALIERWQPNMALTILRGDDDQLDRLLAEGLADLALSHRVSLRSGQSAHELQPERLVLYGTRPDMPVTGNADYLFVDHGEEFRRQHGESYFDAGTARIEFSSPEWAIQHLLKHGGQAYLQRSAACKHAAAGQLFELEEAPAYKRKRYLVSRDNAVRHWSWFPEFADTLARKDRH